MKKYLLAFLILACPSLAFAAPDRAYDLSPNDPTNKQYTPDYYVGIMGGTSTGSNLNGQNINIPLIGGAKAGIYFNKYFGFEVSGLMGPMGTNTQSYSQTGSSSQITTQTVTTGSATPPVTTYTVTKVGGNANHTFCGKPECSGTVTVTNGHMTITTTTSDLNEGNVDDREFFGVTKTVTTNPTTTITTKTTTSTQTSAQTSGYQQNQTLNVESAMGMVRYPFKWATVYAGAGPALLNAPGESIGALSGKIGGEVPFGSIGVFAEEQAISFSSGNQHDMLGMSLAGISVHF